MTSAGAGDVSVSPRDRPDCWAGAVEWQHDRAWSQPWRLPRSRLALAHAPDLAHRAAMAAGVRAVLDTDATGLALEVEMLDDDGSPVDVAVDGEPHARHRLAVGRQRLWTDLPGRRGRLEVWLPQHGRSRIGEVVLRGTRRPPAAVPRGPRWVAYGSSITQCRAAAGPSETWPALVSRRLGLDLTCLGFGSNCHLDPVVAATIADLPADVVSLCVGINIYGEASFNRRTLPGQVSGFVGTVRAAHPGIPVLVMSPISSPDREERPNAVALTLGDVRELVTSAVRLLRNHGDERLTMLDGREVFGPDDAALLLDGVHPGPRGYRVMADRLTPRLAELVDSSLGTLTMQPLASQAWGAGPAERRSYR